MARRFFLDTNIIVYAHAEISTKRTIAEQLIREAHAAGNGSVSEQVVREFCNVASTKFKTTLTTPDILEALKLVLQPLVPSMVLHDPNKQALLLKDRYSLSFYDAAIVYAATAYGCDTLYSEDMQDGARYGQVTVVNPFRSA